MKIPGGNLLRMAQRIICKQTVEYYRDAGRTTSATGRDVTLYEAPVSISSGSIQPVDRARYLNMGLDYKREYITWLVPHDVLGVERDFSGDQIEYNNKRYQLESETDWFIQDGWKSVICVCVKKSNA